MICKDALLLIQSIRGHGYKPNDWEKKFMESIELMMPDKRLSYKQTRAVEYIYAKATGRGIYQRIQRI